MPFCAIDFRYGRRIKTRVASPNPNQFGLLYSSHKKYIGKNTKFVVLKECKAHIVTTCRFIAKIVVSPEKTFIKIVDSLQDDDDVDADLQ